MIELCQLDERRFVIEESRHLTNGCTASKCNVLDRFDVISLTLFPGAMICDLNISFGVCMQICFGCKLSNRSLGVHEPKWTSHVKRSSDVAQS